MKKFIPLIVLAFAANVAYAQFFDDSVAVDSKNRVSMYFDTLEVPVEVNPDLRNNRFILGGIKELKAFKSQKMNLQLVKLDTTVLKNGNIQKIYQFKAPAIIIGQVKLRDYVVEFEYVIKPGKGKPKLVSSHKAEVGLGNLRYFSNAKLEGSTLRLEDIKCEYHQDPKGCGQVVFPVASPIAQNITVRIVPCSLTTDVTQIKSQVRTMLQANNVTIEEETNVPPPQKALNRVSDGLTVRYFDRADKTIARDYQTKLQQQFNGFSVKDENMVPYFDNPIPSYLEIWIK